MANQVDSGGGKATKIAAPTKSTAQLWQEAVVNDKQKYENQDAFPTTGGFSPISKPASPFGNNADQQNADIANAAAQAVTSINNVAKKVGKTAEETWAWLNSTPASTGNTYGYGTVPKYYPGNQPNVNNVIYNPTQMLPIGLSSNRDTWWSKSEQPALPSSKQNYPTVYQTSGPNAIANPWSKAYQYRNAQSQAQYKALQTAAMYWAKSDTRGSAPVLATPKPTASSSGSNGWYNNSYSKYGGGGRGSGGWSGYSSGYGSGSAYNPSAWASLVGWNINR